MVYVDGFSLNFYLCSLFILFDSILWEAMTVYNLSAPAMAAAAGITPNFDNPPNNSTLGWAALTLMMVISALCVMLRAYCKTFLAKRLQIEDCM